jgi:hypothetical protein
MPELRLTLLGVGLMFLIGLAWWEMRRPHQARGSDLPRPTPEPLERTAERPADWDVPALELPRMSARDPEAQLPVVEVEPADFAALEAHAEVSGDEIESFAGDTDPSPQPGTAVAPDMAGMEGLLDEIGSNQIPDPPISDITESFRESAVEDDSFAVESVTVRTIDAPWATPPVAAEPAPEPTPAAAMTAHAPPGDVVVDWPCV